MQCIHAISFIEPEEDASDNRRIVLHGDGRGNWEWVLEYDLQRQHASMHVTPLTGRMRTSVVWRILGGDENLGHIDKLWGVLERMAEGHAAQRPVQSERHGLLASSKRKATWDG